MHHVCRYIYLSICRRLVEGYVSPNQVDLVSIKADYVATIVMRNFLRITLNHKAPYEPG